jgi:DNA-binding response OmpR family regulator
MGIRRPKVLVVDDDELVAFGIHRALYCGIHRFDVLLAPSAEIGRAIMREMGIDVLITDVYLPGMSGLDLACWAAVESPDTQFVLITGDDVSAIRDQARALGCLRLVGKPFEPGELRPIVLEALDFRERLRGTLSTLSAADLIQMLCLGQKTTALRITANGVSGSVMVRDGKLVHATWGDHSGAQAINRIVAVEDGVFSMSPLPAPVPTTITADWQHVLMEAAQLLDERAKDDAAQPSSRPFLRADDATLGDVISDDGWQIGGGDVAVPSVRSEALYRESLRGSADPIVAAARLVDGGFGALRAGNIEHARRCWQAAQRLDPDNRSIELNLRKLESLSSRTPIDAAERK